MRTYQFQMAGIEHLALGRTYEDRLAWRCLAEHTLVLAVADGMTSCPRAPEAADLATQEALGILCAAAPVSIGTYGDALAASSAPVAAFSCARNALLGRASELGCAVSELGTTLMVAQYLEAEPGGGGGELRYAYSGDGGIIVLGNGREARLVVEPQELGEGKTHAVTESSWWRTGSESGVRAFLVATDGLLDALLDQGRPNELAQSILLMGPGHEGELDALLGCVGGDGAPAPTVADVGDDRTLFVCWSEALADDAPATSEVPAEADVPAKAEAPATEGRGKVVPFLLAADRARMEGARRGRLRRKGTARKDTGSRGTSDERNRATRGDHDDEQGWR